MFNDSFGKSILYLFILSIFIFMIFNLSELFFKDNLILSDFEDSDSLVVQKEYFFIKGHTDSIKDIFVNNKEFFLDENNDFNIKVYLFEGVNIFNIRAMKNGDDFVEKKINIIRN